MQYFCIYNVFFKQNQKTLIFIHIDYFIRSYKLASKYKLRISEGSSQDEFKVTINWLIVFIAALLRKKNKKYMFMLTSLQTSFSGMLKKKKKVRFLLCHQQIKTAIHWLYVLPLQDSLEHWAVEGLERLSLGLGSQQL